MSRSNIFNDNSIIGTLFVLAGSFIGKLETRDSLRYYKEKIVVKNYRVEIIDLEAVNMNCLVVRSSSYVV